MKVKSLCFMLVLVFAVAVSADYVVVGKFESNSANRFTDDFRQVWSVSSGGESVAVSPVSGDIYIGHTGDIVRRRDRVTGDMMERSYEPYIRKDDVEMGYDLNGDGCLDIWTVSNSDSLGYIQVYNGSDITQNLASFAVAHTNNQTLDGTGGRGCIFGPDLNGDGVNDFYTIVGWNNEYCRINVWDPVALASASSDAEILAARLASYPASQVREPYDLILGPDSDGDGIMDLWVTSHFRDEIVAYSYLDGSQLQIYKPGGYRPRPIDIMNSPFGDGTIYFTTRFASQYDPDYVDNTETKKGNLLKYDPSTGETTWVFGSSDIGRFSSVAYFSDSAYESYPSLEALVPTTTDILTWSLPEPNDGASDIYVDVYFAENYPDYSRYLDPNIAGVDPAVAYKLNTSFLEYATKVVDNQPNLTSLDLSTITSLPLTYGKNYYWRVDVRDSSDVPAGTITGSVWKFTADNTPPVVNLGGDMVTWLTEGTVEFTIVPDVSDDGKPEGGVMTFNWELIDGVAEDIDIVLASDIAPTFTVTNAGTFTLKLTVSDGELANYDLITINVYSDACAAAQVQDGYTALDGDVNNDCKVDLADLGMLSANWLGSTAME